MASFLPTMRRRGIVPARVSLWLHLGSSIATTIQGRRFKQVKRAPASHSLPADGAGVELRRVVASELLAVGVRLRSLPEPKAVSVGGRSRLPKSEIGDVIDAGYPLLGLAGLHDTFHSMEDTVDSLPPAGTLSSLGCALSKIIVAAVSQSPAVPATRRTEEEGRMHNWQRDTATGSTAVWEQRATPTALTAHETVTDSYYPAEKVLSVRSIARNRTELAGVLRVVRRSDGASARRFLERIRRAADGRASAAVAVSQRQVKADHPSRDGVNWSVGLDSFLYFPRVPKTGSTFILSLMRACSSRSAAVDEAAAGFTDTVATDPLRHACSGRSPQRLAFTFHGRQVCHNRLGIRSDTARTAGTARIALCTSAPTSRAACFFLKTLQRPGCASSPATYSPRWTCIQQPAHRYVALRIDG